MAPTSVRGRLVLDDRVAVGELTIEDGLIAAVELDEGADDDSLPYIAPGFVDVHVHGWGGHDAMGGRAALDGMARGLLRQGVTSFLPTAVTAPLADAGLDSPTRPRAGDRPRPPTARSRSGSTSRARSSPSRSAAPTTRRACGPRPTSTPPTSSRCSTASAS